MTTCDDGSVQREFPDLGAGTTIITPDPDASILVTDPRDEFDLTARHEGDEHSAIVEGLASYLSRLESSIAGRRIALSRVVTNYADHHDGSAISPSAAVYSFEVGAYSTTSGMGGNHATPLGKIEGQQQMLAIVETALYELEQLEVAVWCEDDVQRSGVRRMLVDAFHPVEWKAGFRLVLPRYHNAICDFLLLSAQQADSAETAGPGLRPLTMRLSASCSVYRLHEMPLAHPTVTGTIGLGKRRI